MAYKGYKGIKVKFEADSSQLGKALKDIDSKASETNKNLKSVNQALKFEPKNTELLGKKFEQLGTRINQANERLQTLKHYQSSVEDAFKTGKIDQGQYDAFCNEISRTENQLRSLGRESNQVSARIGEQLSDSIKKAEADVKSFTKVIMAGETALVTLSAKSVKTGMNFESSMSQVAATMSIDRKSDEYKKLSDSAKEMGKNTSFSASQAADALNYLALAGYDADKAVETLPKTLTLAKAGGMDLAAASDMMTDAMSALGLETNQADNFINEMAKTAQKSNTNVAQLGEGILTCAGAVSTTGQSLETMNTALGVLADNGLKGAEGGTHIRNILLSLANPTDKATKLLNEMGISVTDSKGKIRDLNDIMTDLSKNLASENGKRTQQLGDIFNKTDLNAVNALLKSTANRFGELKSEISNSEGAAEQMSKTMSDNLAGDLTTMKSEAEALQIAVSEKLTPSLRDAAQYGNSELKELIDSVTDGDLSGTIDQFGKDISEFLKSGIDTAAQVLPTVIKFLTQIMKHLEAILRIYIALKAVPKSQEIVSNLLTMEQGLKNYCTSLLSAENGQRRLILSSAEMLNVMVGISGVLISVSLAFKSYVDNMKVVPEEYDKLNSEYKKLAKSVDELLDKSKEQAETYKKNSDQIKYHANICKITADEIFKLANKEKLSAKETTELKGKIAELNNEIPNLNLNFDENSKSLNKNRSEVEKLINSYAGMLQSQEAAKRLSEVKVDLAVGEESFDELDKAWRKAQAEYVKTRREFENFKKNNEEYLKDGKFNIKVSGDKINGDYIKARSEYDRLYNANERARESVSKLYYDYAKLKGERENQEVEVKKLTEIIGENSDALNNDTNALENNADATDKVTDSTKSLADIKKDVVELYEKKYDSAIDKLNEEKSALESQKKFLENKKQAIADVISEYEKAADVVQKYIDKQREEIEDRYNSEIDKIKSVNEEKQESVDLQEKLNALENAKKKKVNVYSESQGWYLESNQSEIDKAQKDYDNAVLDKQISDLEKKRDEELKLWDNYKQQWQDIVDDIKNADDEITASKILGSDWTEKIAQKDTDILNQFGQAYNYYQNDLSKQVDSEIDSIENAIDAKENQIKVYTEEKNALKDYVEDIEESNQTYLDNLNNMALSERSTMEERVAFLEACKERIKRAMDMSDTAVSSGQNDISITDSNGNTSHNFNPDKRYHVKYNAQELGSPSSRREAESIRDTYIRNHAGEFGMAGLLIAGTLNPISSQFADYVARKIKEARKQFSIKQYRKGGVIDYTGIAKVDGTKSSPEVVFSNSQAKKLYDIVSQSGDLSAKISQNISGSILKTFADTMKNLMPANNIRNETVSNPTNITIHIDRVETPDGQNFVRQMEGYLKQTELDRMVGKKR